MNKLEQLKLVSKIVVDSSEFTKIQQYQPIDVTTNPSLLANAAKMEQYDHIIEKALKLSSHLSGKTRIREAVLDLLVAFGVEILNVIPGRVSTEVDVRLSFNIKRTVDYARKIIHKYKKLGVDRSRVFIKIASTWEGIKAAEILEKENINCNLTLIFDLVQAMASAQAGVFLISPFVGRITDWHMQKSNFTDFPNITEDKGIFSVKEIYHYCKAYNYKTVVMGASFRHVGQIEALAGCDALTISPNLLQQLQKSSENLVKDQLNEFSSQINKNYKVTEDCFRWVMNESAMATDKLSEGIRQFAVDTVKLEKIIEHKLGI